MTKPVFKFCIHRTFDDDEVVAEIADIQRLMIDTAYEAYLALPWYRRISQTFIADAISKAFFDGFEDALDRLKDKTVRL